MAKVRIRALGGALLRDHKDKFKIVPAEGKMVELDRTWRRRIKDGDAVVVKEAVAKVPEKVLAPKPVEKSADDNSKAVKETK